MDDGTVSLYVHVPFCDLRCPYCHFTCFVNRDVELFDRWARAVVREFALHRELGRAERIGSVYFGGGTPTALPPRARALVCEWLADEVGPRLVDGAEVTLEANPESAWGESLRPWVDAGVGRISLGIQSMDPEVLQFLGRLNTPASNLRALELACSLVPEVSADLIVASPPDRWAALHRSIEAISAHPVDHVSAYLLEIHDNTRFGRDVAAGRWTPAPDERQRALYLRVVDELGRRGYAAYELSNFAQPGHEARHNQRYWRREPYLGLGPSAHSFADERRWANQADTRRWIEEIEAGRLAVDFEEHLDHRAARRERVLLGLRTREGIPRVWVAERGGWILRAVSEGWLVDDGEYVRATPEGWLLLDEIVVALVD